MKNKTLSKYFATIGAKGGSVTGPSKMRGDKAYYAEISRKSWESRRKKPKSK